MAARFCPNCGKSVSADATSCPSCWTTLVSRQAPTSITAYQPYKSTPGKSPTFIIIVVSLVIMLVLGAVGAVLAFNYYNNLTSHVPESYQIIAGGFYVDYGHRYNVSFTISSSYSSVVVNGSFTTTGGQSRVFIFNQSNYTSWASGHSFSSYYDSGTVSTEKINAHLPDGSGIYYIIYNNPSTVPSSENVSTWANAYYIVNR